MKAQTKEDLLLRGLVFSCPGRDRLVLRGNFSPALCGLELVAPIYSAESPFAGELFGGLAAVRRAF